MTRIDMSSVIVQEMIRSKHAKHRYRLAPQRRGIGTVDLRDVKNKKQLRNLLREYVGKRGTYSLLARDSKGRLSRCIGIIRIREGGIAFKDQRCALAVIIRNREKKKVADLRI